MDYRSLILPRLDLIDPTSAINLDGNRAATQRQGEADLIGGFAAAVPAEPGLIHVGLRDAGAAGQDRPLIHLTGDRSAEGIDAMRITYADASQETTGEESTTFDIFGGSLVVQDGENFVNLEPFTTLVFDNNITTGKIATFVEVLAGAAVVFSNDLQQHDKPLFPLRVTNWTPVHPAFFAEMRQVFEDFRLYFYNQNHDHGEIIDAWTDTRIFYADATDETRPAGPIAPNLGKTVGTGCGTVQTPYGFTRYSVLNVVNFTKEVVKAQMLDAGAAVLIEVVLVECAADFYSAAIHLFP